MTLEEFLQHLTQCAGEGWDVNWRGMLRHGEYDPITFLATRFTGKHYDSSQVQQAAHALLLTKEDRDQLIRATDRRMAHVDEFVLRRRLRKICNVEDLS